MSQITKTEFLKLKINKFEFDSRQIVPGDVFVCQKGNNLDSHQFIEDVIEKGVTAVITAHDINDNISYIKLNNFSSELAEILKSYYHNPQEKLNIVGVTGTNGKTSITYLLYCLLNKLGITSGYIGTLGYTIDQQISQTIYTTPDICKLYNILAQAAVNAQALIMEVSSHALKQERIAGINFDVAVFSNISEDHLDYHHTMNDYIASKQKLFHKLKKKHTAVINLDDEHSDFFLIKGNNNLTYSLKNPQADLFATEIQNSIYGNCFNLIYKNKHYPIKSNLIADFNIENLLAVISAALHFEPNLQNIINKIPELPAVPGRLETFQVSNSPLIVVDFAHSSDSIQKIVTNIKKLIIGKIYIVFGVTGDRLNQAKIISQAATTAADYAMLTTDNPLGLDPQQIISEMIKGVSCPFDSDIDRSQAITKVLEMAKYNDAVLICGKGPENYQYMNKDKNIKTPYASDMQLVKDYFCKSLDNKIKKNHL